MLAAGEALGVGGEAKGPTSRWVQGLGPGRLSPRDKGSFGLKCWGGGAASSPP